MMARIAISSDASATQVVRFVEHERLRGHLVLRHAERVLGDADVGEDAVELLEALAHRVLERRALAHLLGEVDGDDLGVALGLETVAGALEAALPLEVVRQLAVVDDGDVGERIRPVGCAPEMSTSDSVAMRTWPIAWVPLKSLEVVAAGDRLGVAEVLDDLERVAEREHLDVGHVLDEVGEPLEVAVVRDRDAERVLGLLLELLDLGAERVQAALDLGAVPAQPVLVLEVARRVRVGELVAHDHEVRRLAVERVARRVRARGASSTGASASSPVPIGCSPSL